MSDADLFRAAVQLVLSLLLVAALAYLAVRYGLGRHLAFSRGRYMRVIEQLPLGPKAALTLVQVGRRYYLLAHQENNVTLLQEFDHLPEGLPFPDTPAGKGSGPASFQRELSAALDRLKKRFAGDGPPETSAKKHQSYLDGQKDERSAGE